MVLHLIDTAGMYGAENVVLTLLDELRDSEYKGVLGCIREQETEVPIIAENAMKLDIPVVFFTMRRGLNINGIRKILRYIHDNHIKLVHSHGYKTNIFLAILPKKNFKIISTVHGWAKNTVGIKTKLYEYLDSLSLKKMDSVVAVSNAVYMDIVNSGIKIKNMHIIYNGIKTKSLDYQFDCAQIRKKYGYTIKDFIIGSVGRLTRVKGHVYLIKALPSILREIQECKIIIAGDGPLKNELQSIINEYNLSKHVQLIGYTQHVDEILAMIDLFVLPSISEGLPIALLEAMALEKTILASNVGGIPEVINSHNVGILTPPAEPESIAIAIKKLYRKKEYMRRLGINGKQIVENKFSSKNMANQYSAIYSNLSER